MEGCRGGGLGGWSAKTGWGAVDDPMDLVCVTCRLRARERRELAAHLPQDMRSAAACLQTVKLGDWPHLTSAFFKVRPHVISDDTSSAETLLAGGSRRNL